MFKTELWGSMHCSYLESTIPDGEAGREAPPVAASVGRLSTSSIATKSN